MADATYLTMLSRKAHANGLLSETLSRALRAPLPVYDFLPVLLSYP